MESNPSNNPFYSYDPQIGSQVLPVMPNYSLSPAMLPGSYTSPAVSPQPPFPSYSYNLNPSGQTPYNIPVDSHASNLNMEQIIGNVNILDLDNLNIQHQPGPDLNDARAINLPFTDSNINLIESHLFSGMLSNLSIHDEEDANVKDNEASVSRNNILTELPEVTFSGMFSSTDLDGALDRITSLSKK